MALKPIIETDTEHAALPDALKGEYKKNGEGKYVLDVTDGLVPKAQVDEMRERNIIILRERDAADRELKAYKDIGDIAIITELKNKEQDLADAKLVKAGKIEEVVTQRTEVMRKDFEKKLADSDKEKKDMNDRLSNLMIDEEVSKECLRLGVRAAAIPLVKQQVRARTKMENGKPVVYKEDGTTKDYNAKSHEMSVAELTEAITVAAPFVLEENAGSGGRPRENEGRGGNGSYTGPNPWKKGADHSLDKQMELVRKQPQLAKRLKEEAGVPTATYEMAS